MTPDIAPSTVLRLQQAIKLHEDGEIQAASAAYEALLPELSADPRLLTPYGILQLQLGDPRKAEACLTQSLRRSPGQVNALLNLGNTFQRLNRPNAALEKYNQTIQLAPDYAAAYYNRANLRFQLKDVVGALRDYERAYQIEPESQLLLGKLLLAKLHLCDWEQLDRLKRLLRQGIEGAKRVSTPFPAQCVLDSARLQQKNTCTYCVPLQGRKSLDEFRGGSSARERRIRIGYFSSDFCDHPVSHLFSAVLETHDRNRFDIYAFSLIVRPDDPWRRRVERAVTRFIDVSALSDHEVCKLSRELEIDIAIDLNGHTTNSRTGIFIEKAAPVQVSYIGYLGTMGLPQYDYLIADDTIVPASQRDFYSEKILYLPWFQANAPISVPQSPGLTRSRFDIPDDSILYCCFNSNYKITPEIFGAWMEILAEVPESLLWLHVGSQEARSNILREGARRGVEPERIRFAEKLPLEDHIARQRLADLFLDTFPYNAGATASSALRAGLPVLTLLGSAFPSRMGASILKAADLPELIAESLDQYKETAIALGRDPDRLRAMRSKLESSRAGCRLFDTVTFTRHLESAYHQVHSRNLNRQAPDHLLETSPLPPIELPVHPMKTFLHVGCGKNRIDSTTRGFNDGTWAEIRLDIDESVAPDITGTMTDMSAVESKSVDALFSSHNIEHLYAHEVPVALKEFLRVLKPDGFCVITCPDLQSVCALVAQDKLIEAAYVSPAGPIAPIDILYGHRPAMAKGNLFMAHRCGFTAKVLRATLYESGFGSVAMMRREGSFDLWAIASKPKIGEGSLMQLAQAHFPSA